MINMEIYAVKINGLQNPIGFDDDLLLCSWKIRNSKGKHQKNTILQVSLDETFQKIVWEKEGNLNSFGEKIEALLSPHTRYFFRITVFTDSDDEISSNTYFFETAKLSESWKAKWIGVSDNDMHPEFQKSFSVEGNVLSGRLYICGLGYFRVSVNGCALHPNELDPAHTDYTKTCQYVMFPQIEAFKAGDNTVDITVAAGWRSNESRYWNENAKPVRRALRERTLLREDHAGAGGQKENHLDNGFL